MFEIKIAEIITTICVGSLSLLLCIYIYFLFAKLFIADKFDNELFTEWIKKMSQEKVRESWGAFIITIAIYFFGILAGDLTGRLTDSDDNKNIVLRKLKMITFMEPEGDLRKEALINLHSDSSLTGLGKAVFLNAYVVEEGNKTAGTTYFRASGNILTSWNQIRDSIRHSKNYDSTFTNFVFQIYYTSKNWVYSKEHEPLKEMKDIQHRIDLSRSIVLITALGLILIVLMMFTYGNWYLILLIRKKVPTSFYIPVKGVVLILALLILCRLCYHINEINYLKRAFGYYVSYVQKREERANNRFAEDVNLAD